MPDVGVLEILVVLAIGALWLAVVGLIIYGAAAVVGRRRSATTRDATVADPAMADLRALYARGEIDQAEFEQRRSVLQGR